MENTDFLPYLNSAVLCRLISVFFQLRKIYVKTNRDKKAFHYFIMGWDLIRQRGLRRFVVMPILLNILLLSGLLWLFINRFSTCPRA